MLIAVILTIFTTIYCLAVFFVGFLLSQKQKNRQSGQPFVSIVIAARNEAKRIKPTLDSLLKLNYPVHLFEIILVDDNSDDCTADIIDSYLTGQKNWRLFRLQEAAGVLKGKKAALHQGVAKAQGEIILTTDADCRVPSEWIQTMTAFFDEDTDMVLGHSLLEKKGGLLDILLRFDNLFSGIMVAAPTLAGFPISSVGRNMAFRKASYYQSGGYSSLAHFKSGDDVHLTERFRRHCTGKIVFNVLRKSFTLTRPPDSFKEIFHQQIRKNSKLFKKSAQSILLTVFLFLYHLGLVLFPFLIPKFIDLWLFLIFFKVVSEFVVLALAAKKFGETGLILYIPFLQLFYPLYVTLMALLGTFQVFEWKNRK